LLLTFMTAAGAVLATAALGAVAGVEGGVLTAGNDGLIEADPAAARAPAPAVGISGGDVPESGAQPLRSCAQTSQLAHVLRFFRVMVMDVMRTPAHPCCQRCARLAPGRAV
jgi:hypothetical protein